MQPTDATPPLLRLLVADDDPILGAMAGHTLSEFAEVTTVEDGRAAWAVLEVQTFDLVLLDLEMPLMDGFDVLTRIRGDARLARLPVIVLTGRQDHWAIQEAFDRGATSYITKPMSWPQLGHQVRFVLRAANTDKMLDAVRSAVA